MPPQTQALSRNMHSKTANSLARLGFARCRHAQWHLTRVRLADFSAVARAAGLSFITGKSCYIMRLWAVKYIPCVGIFSRQKKVPGGHFSS